MNDDRELEDLLRASMKHHAEEMPEIGSVHTRRRRTPVLVAAAASVVVVTAGAVALTTLAPLLSEGSGGSASASTRLDLGGPRPLFSQEFSAGDGSSAAAAVGQAGFISLSLAAVKETSPLCVSSDPQHVQLTPSDVTAIYICHGGSLTQEDGSIWSTAIVDQVVGGIDELLAAAAISDEPLTSGMCNLLAYGTPIITVHGSGTAVNLAPPLDGCHAPLPAWTSAFKNLTVQKVREIPIEIAQSSLATETGCPYKFKDMLILEKPGKAKGSPEPLSDVPMTMCVYQTDHVIEGTLIAGLRLTTKNVEIINESYQKIVLSDPECDPTVHDHFVVLNEGNNWVQIALNGCGILDRTGMRLGSSDLGAYLVWLIQNSGQGKALLNR